MTPGTEWPRPDSPRRRAADPEVLRSISAVTGLDQRAQASAIALCRRSYSSRSKRYMSSPRRMSELGDGTLTKSDLVKTERQCACRQLHGSSSVPFALVPHQSTFACAVPHLTSQASRNTHVLPCPARPTPRTNRIDVTSWRLRGPASG